MPSRSRNFGSCRSLGQKGVDAVHEWLLKDPSVSSVEAVKGKLPQTTKGDLFVTHLDGRNRYIEVKTEWSDKYGNFFIETVSNDAAGKVGWLYKSQFDDMIYNFASEKKSYIIDGKRLRDWAETKEFLKYPEKSQTKNQQANLTKGRPVPIKVLIEKGIAKEVKVY